MSAAAHIVLESPGYAKRAARRHDTDNLTLWAILDAVTDPEIPVLSLWQLGVLQDIYREDATVVVVVTPTYSGCPAFEAMQQDIRGALREVGHASVRIDVQLRPAWTTDWLSAASRRALQTYGVAPPGASPVAVACPHCGATDVRVISEFGSTACKALYRCGACAEPFDYFKPL